MNVTSEASQHLDARARRKERHRLRRRRSHRSARRCRGQVGQAPPGPRRSSVGLDDPGPRPRSAPDRRRRRPRHARVEPVRLPRAQGRSPHRGCALHAAPSRRPDGPRQPSHDRPLPSNESARRTKTSGSDPSQPSASTRSVPPCLRCAARGTVASLGSASNRHLSARRLPDLPMSRVRVARLVGVKGGSRVA
jgi:hypothetical protein